jgi:hypothetical protein
LPGRERYAGITLLKEQNKKALTGSARHTLDSLGSENPGRGLKAQVLFETADNIVKLRRMGMASISGISSSLLTSLVNGQQSNPVQTTSGQVQDAGSADSADLVSLLGDSTASDDSLYGLLSGTQGSDSSDSMYNLLLAGANAQLMKDNPTLVQAILSADQTQTTSAGTSSGSTQAQTTGTQALQDLQNIDLLTMSPTTIASVLQQYLQSKNSATQSTSGSQVDQSV